jgi:uncharacterized protein (DUF1330 family)
MFTMLTVVRKRPEVSTQEFRRFMEFDYGPLNAALPHVREYVQYYLDDATADDAEDPIDAIVRISFDSQDAMRSALDSDAYRRAHEIRGRYMRATSVGIHSAVVDREVRPAPWTGE